MYERLLEPDCNDLPKCSCGAEMFHLKTRTKSKDADVKQFACSHCGRELHLMVWPVAVFAPLSAEAAS
jgi:hypothetical protein